MSTYFQQPTSPEMSPELAARLRTIGNACHGLHEVLRSDPAFAQFLAGVQVVNEQMKVPEVIDYTIQPQSTVNLDLVSSDVSLVGFEQHKRQLDAEQELADIFREAA